MTNHAVAEAMERHHAAMVADLYRLTAQLDPAGAWEAAREAVLDYLRREVLPHATAEEDTVYQAAGADTRLAPLVASMRYEHTVLKGLHDALQAADTALDAVRLAAAVAHLFEAHAEKENRFILPALESRPEGSLETVLGALKARLAGS